MRGGERTPVRPRRLSRACLEWWAVLDRGDRIIMLRRARAKWGALAQRELIHLAFTKLPETPIDGDVDL